MLKTLAVRTANRLGLFTRAQVTGTLRETIAPLQRDRDDYKRQASAYAQNYLDIYGKVAPLERRVDHQAQEIALLRQRLGDITLPGGVMVEGLKR